MLYWTVSEYESRTEYGGPEEGGWDYEWLDFVEAVEGCITEEEAIDYAKQLNSLEETPKYKHEVRRVYLVEIVPGSKQTTERPHYQ